MTSQLHHASIQAFWAQREHGECQRLRRLKVKNGTERSEDWPQIGSSASESSEQSLHTPNPFEVHISPRDLQVTSVGMAGDGDVLFEKMESLSAFPRPLFVNALPRALPSLLPFEVSATARCESRP